jgi:hypothetical protein
MARVLCAAGVVRAERGSVARTNSVAVSPNELPASVLQPETRPLQIAICKLAAHKHATAERRIIIRLQRAGLGKEPERATPIRAGVIACRPSWNPPHLEPRPSKWKIAGTAPLSPRKMCSTPTFLLAQRERHYFYGVALRGNRANLRLISEVSFNGLLMRRLQKHGRCSFGAAIIYMLAPIDNQVMLVLGFPLGFFANGLFTPMGPYLTELFPTKSRLPIRCFRITPGVPSARFSRG